MENRIVKILAIDDNKDNLTILKALIMEAFPNAIMLTAFSGQKGLEIGEKEEPDVILLDIIMPGMDGYETCRKLKADKKLCDIPVVFVTAIKSDKASRIKALESGADAFLTKPIDESELTAQIRAMLKIREANIEKRNDRERLAILLEEKTRELVKSEAKYRQIAENVTDVVWMADLDMKTTYITPSVVKMLGESPEAHMKRTVEEKFTPDSLKRLQTLLSEELEREKDLKSDKSRSQIIELEHYRADRSGIWVSIHTSFLRDENGTVIGLQGVSRDITESKQTENELLRLAAELDQQRNDLEKRLLQSVNAISKIGELRDIYTAGHQRRVEALSCAIGREMGLAAEQIHNLSFGALIHDIGKFFIPSEILNKPGKISDLEYQILQTHVEESHNVVKEIDFPEEIHTMIYQHHERMDGSGYPQGLSGDEIILQSRILAVADVVEAMTSHRPYRPALGIDSALEEILLHRGTKYDAEVVDICVKLFKEDGYAF